MCRACSQAALKREIAGRLTAHAIRAHRDGRRIGKVRGRRPGQGLHAQRVAIGERAVQRAGVDQVHRDPQAPPRAYQRHHDAPGQEVEGLRKLRALGRRHQRMGQADGLKRARELRISAAERA